MLWFAREDNSFVGWFITKKTTGALRTGLVAADFTVTVVNPADDATSVPTVTESTSKPGSYSFTIPSAFTTTHGVGNYIVVVEVNTKVGGGSGAPHVVDAFGAILVISTDDFDTIGANAALIPINL